MGGLKEQLAVTPQPFDPFGNRGRLLGGLDIRRGQFQELFATIAQAFAGLPVHLPEVLLQVVDEKAVLHVVKQVAELLIALA